MPRKRKSKLRPKLPSRVKKTRTKRGARARQHHPELWGLGSVALGLYLGAVLYFGWNGGYVGGWLGDGLDRLIGDAKYVVPVALVVLGALMVTRSALVEVRPFRTGLAVLGCGLMITLGKDQGGSAAARRGSALAAPDGAPVAARRPADAVRRGHVRARRVSAAGLRRPPRVARARGRVGRDGRARRRAARADARSLRRGGDGDRPDLRPARGAR